MHLESLELFGFKSFAERTKLNFLPPTEGSHGITAVVGPNGSGKSNVADAIRWVLGEQSLKLLRGKKAEDVIFSGSEKRGRSGFAEVTLRLNNEDNQLPVDWSEVAITRRVYRDGESEYLINKAKVRLADVQLLLAQAQIGSRSYAVIGQGLADAILSATPEERKDFFDEAAGVKHHQIKRQQSANKLATSRENLLQAELLINEIEPRLRSLARQVDRLNTRATAEQELLATKTTYYSHQWQTISAELTARQSALNKATTDYKELEASANSARQQLADLQKQSTNPKDDTWQQLQKNYQNLIEERSVLERQLFQLQSKLEVAKEVRKQTTNPPLPLSKIIEGVKTIAAGQSAAIATLSGATNLEEAQSTIPQFAATNAATTNLATQLERPAVETVSVLQPEADPKLLGDITAFTQSVDLINSKITQTKTDLANRATQEQASKNAFFDIQRQLESQLNACHIAERLQTETRIELARVETRRDAVATEIKAELPTIELSALPLFPSSAPTSTEPLENITAKISKLKYQLELIGGIDPEVIKEHTEIKSRYDFLSTQITDLRQAIEDLEKVIAELDTTIAAISAASFRELNKNFSRFFHHLFNGGKAELKEIHPEINEDQNQDGSAFSALPLFRSQRHRHPRLPTRQKNHQHRHALRRRTRHDRRRSPLSHHGHQPLPLRRPR